MTAKKVAFNESYVISHILARTGVIKESQLSALESKNYGNLPYPG